jgi:hypothetical protein
MSSRGEPKFAFGGAAPPEVSVRLRWPSGQNDGANSGAPDADDVFASGSPRAVGAAAGSPASSPSSPPVASADSLGSSLSAPRGAASSAGAHAERGGKELLDTLTERVRELEAQHRRDVQEIELLRAEVDSKTAEVAAKEADIKLKDTELAQAEQVAHSRGLLVESLLAELEEMKTSLEYAQLETMALSNGVDFVKAAQVRARAHILSPNPAGRAVRVCGGCRVSAGVRRTRARALPLTSTRLRACACAGMPQHRV